MTRLSKHKSKAVTLTFIDFLSFRGTLSTEEVPELTIGLVKLLSDFISNDALFSVFFEGLQDSLSAPINPS